MKHVCVVGPGTMGKGITQVFIQSGYSVTLVGHTRESVERAEEDLGETFSTLQKDGKITSDEVEEYQSHLSFTTDTAEIDDCDIVVEAVPEKMEIKKKVFSEVSERFPDAILASNTSSLSITELAAVCVNPERMLGLHFFNPAPVMDLVEVVRGEETTDDVHQEAVELVEDLGKTPVTVRDSPGFVSNRLLMIYLNEAFRALEEGIATKNGIDTVAELGFNHPMGPLELADHIGLDVCLDILEVLHEEIGDKYEPADVLREKVEKGELGKKTGKGFYDY